MAITKSTPYNQLYNTKNRGVGLNNLFILKFCIMKKYVNKFLLIIGFLLTTGLANAAIFTITCGDGTQHNYISFEEADTFDEGLDVLVAYIDLCLR
jgi:hypothetical protein